MTDREYVTLPDGVYVVATWKLGLLSLPIQLRFDCDAARLALIQELLTMQEVNAIDQGRSWIPSDRVARMNDIAILRALTAAYHAEPEEQ